MLSIKRLRIQSLCFSGREQQHIGSSGQSVDVSINGTKAIARPTQMQSRTTDPLHSSSSSLGILLAGWDAPV